ncbi:hypothetical protein C8Q74DRAFT_1004381 [Fomes fomentarius]|nr:hypothetical protein C8Q74DRAFT_1004381 [Fomes fomentarius]
MSLPETIHAIAINKAGDFDVIEKLELPFPQNAPGNVLVKVHYGGVTFVDTYYRKGLYPIKSYPIKSFPYAIGVEAEGVIVSWSTEGFGAMWVSKFQLMVQHATLHIQRRIVSISKFVGDWVGPEWVAQTISTRVCAAFVRLPAAGHHCLVTHLQRAIAASVDIQIARPYEL